MKYFIFSNNNHYFILKNNFLVWDWSVMDFMEGEDFLSIKDKIISFAAGDFYFKNSDIVFNNIGRLPKFADDIASMRVDSKFSSTIFINPIIRYDIQMIELDDDGFNLWKELNIVE